MSLQVRSTLAESDSDPFPYVFECDTPPTSLGGALEWAKVNAGEFSPLASRHGAILFRGFGLETAEDFDLSLIHI